MHIQLILYPDEVVINNIVLKDYVALIVKTPGVAGIVLTGSRAYGYQSESSDYDVEIFYYENFVISELDSELKVPRFDKIQPLFRVLSVNACDKVFIT